MQNNFLFFIIYAAYYRKEGREFQVIFIHLRRSTIYLCIAECFKLLLCVLLRTRKYYSSTSRAVALVQNRRHTFSRFRYYLPAHICGAFKLQHTIPFFSTTPNCRLPSFVPRQRHAQGFWRTEYRRYLCTKPGV